MLWCKEVLEHRPPQSGTCDVAGEWSVYCCVLSTEVEEEDSEAASESEEEASAEKETKQKVKKEKTKRKPREKGEKKTGRKKSKSRAGPDAERSGDETAEQGEPGWQSTSPQDLPHPCYGGAKRQCKQPCCQKLQRLEIPFIPSFRLSLNKIILSMHLLLNGQCSCPLCYQAKSIWPACMSPIIAPIQAGSS